MRNEEYLIDLLEKANVIKYGHFVGTSGKHLDTYVLKDAIIRNGEAFPEICNELARLIIRNIQNWKRVHFLTGPATVGAVFAGIIGFILNKPFVFPEKENVSPIEVEPDGLINDTRMVFRRGHNRAIKGKSLIIVEDVATTGGSITKTANAISENGGIVIGVALIWNRSNFHLQGVPTFSLINRELDSWKKLNCPMCMKGIKIDDIKA